MGITLFFLFLYVLKHVKFNYNEICQSQLNWPTNKHVFCCFFSKLVFLQPNRENSESIPEYITIFCSCR